jgi:hypothetical protein
VDPLDLIRLNVGIENRIDAGGDLSALPGKASALLSAHRYAGGYAFFFRRDIPGDIRAQIRALPPEQVLTDHAAVRRILGQAAPCGKVFAGKGYYFARMPAPAEYAGVVRREDGCHVVKIDGMPVCFAWTQDGSDQADELAVETLPEFRRRGYARRAASAWAAAVMQAGRVAFYSHKIENTVSEALAHSLGVVQYALSTGYE